VTSGDPRSATIALTPFGPGGGGVASLRRLNHPGGAIVSTKNDMCMDVARGSRDNGAAVQVAGCSGNAAQQFVLTPAGDLVNPQANTCVDIRERNPDNDALLQLWECSGGANQKWRRGEESRFT
jgi:hypothetical protein